MVVFYQSKEKLLLHFQLCIHDMLAPFCQWRYGRKTFPLFALIFQGDGMEMNSHIFWHPCQKIPR